MVCVRVHISSVHVCVSGVWVCMRVCICICNLDGAAHGIVKTLYQRKHLQKHVQDRVERARIDAWSWPRRCKQNEIKQTITLVLKRHKKENSRQYMNNSNNDKR